MPALARAELPPQVYAEMQAKAEELLKIEVLTSVKEPGSVENATPPQHGFETFRVHLTARVLKVERSKSGLKADDEISIDYTRTERPKDVGWVGPAEIPLLKKGDVAEAYLDLNPKARAYSPAARGRSFRTIVE